MHHLGRRQYLGRRYHLRHSHHLGRWLAATAATTVALAASVFGFAPPAAALALKTIAADKWAWTDANQPDQSHVGATADAPLGTWAQSVGRFYASFDLTSFTGRTVHQAEFFVQEKKVTDCATDTTIEVRRTKPIEPTTSWHNAPEIVESLGTVARDACPDYVTLDLLAPVRDALARGETRLTLELRVTESQEHDPAAGRLLAYRAGLNVWSNAVPTVSSVSLFYEKTCATQPAATVVNGRYTTLSTQLADQDNPNPNARFAVWPVDHPDQRREQQGTDYGSGFVRRDWDTSGYPDGTVLAFAAQAFDDDDASPWSQPCYARVDSVAPRQAPVVSSTDYPADGQPHGGDGIAGTFRFDAQGDTDVVSYRWSDGSGRIFTAAAPAPGAAAEVSYTPQLAHFQHLTVSSIDAAGNSGPATGYEFWIRDTRPEIQITNGGVGLPSKLKLWSPLPETTGFGYRVGDGDESRVPAVDSRATPEVVFTRKGLVTVTVKVYVGDDVVGIGTENVYVDDQPTVESADFSAEHDGVIGVEGGFTFKPRTAGVVAYKYRIGSDEERTVDADGDGVAGVRWTPTEPGYQSAVVRSVTADGTESDSASYNFMINDPRPWVYLPDLVNWPRTDGPGLPTRVEFTSSMPDVTEFLYRFDDGPRQSVTADQGWSTVSFTPTHAGDNTVIVQAKFADGTISAERVETFTISSGPLVSSAEYPWYASSGEQGLAGTFVFRPALPGVANYTYSFEDDSDVKTVEATADGTASVVLTPHGAGYYMLRVTSHSADGTASDERMYEFFVRDNRTSVSGGDGAGIGTPIGIGLTNGLSDDLTEYRYRLNDQPEQHMAVSRDGITTRIQVVPDRNGENVLTVWGVRAAGGVTPTTTFRFEVGTAPYVTSAEYPEGQWGGGPGVPGTFHVSGGAPGIVEFEWRADDGPPATVEADADGTATFTYTPTEQWATVTLHVRGRTADGTWTDDKNYYFYVS